MTLARGDDDLGLARDFGRASFSCPKATLCLDRVRSLSGSLYGRVEADGQLRIGARTSFKRASISLALVGSGGPQASIVVPVSHWLGIERWLPLEARLAVGLDGISIDPGFTASAD